VTRAGVTQARPHSLSDAAFAALAAGRPDSETVAELRRAQLSRHLLLIRAIVTAAPDTAGPGYAELAAAERADPAGVRELLARPMVGLWAAGCLSALRGGASPEEAGAGQLAGLARPAGGERYLTASHDGLRIKVRLEDSDPLRSRLGLTPAPRLTDAEVARWQDALTAAWQLLVERVRPEAEVLAAVLDCIVPVEPDSAARGISATSADAFGAVAISEPADATALAVGLLHETQHSILNAVHYLFDLHEMPDALGYSPWRDDPRPASGILHGAYAYLTVTRFWRAFPGEPLAEFEFARWREAVLTAADGLLAPGPAEPGPPETRRLVPEQRKAGPLGTGEAGLTEAGTRFVTALRGEARSWLDDPVAPEVARLAASANRDHYLRWRLRNRHVDPADARALAAAWRSGAAPPAVRSHLRPAPRRALEASARLDLTHRLLRGETLPAGDADAAYVRGDLDTAVTAYRSGVDWVGLALALRWRAAPELVAATHRALGDPGADPLALAAWLTP